ncbi:MAG: amidase [Rhizobiaceae bacterium]
MKPETAFTGPELCRLSAADAVALLKKGDVKPSELLEASLTRIEQVEAGINAVVTVCAERARESLADLDARARRNGGKPGWLGGLPIAIKDLNDVAGVRTTYGTKGFADHVPETSDPLVERLEDNGGIIVGKTNTPEFGAGGNTFNDVFGMTRNPWDTRKNAGGSSGGAAVSLAAGEVWLSHGSDLAGSLRTPAAYCGIVGLRTSPGRAGGGSVKAAFQNAGVQGPMARDILDTALFLDAMAGYDPRQPLTIDAPAEPFQKAVREADARVRIAWAPTLGGFAPVEAEIEQVMRAALEKAERNGARVEEACPDLPELEPTYVTLRALTWEAGPGRQPPHIQRHFKATLAENIEVGRNLTVDQVVDAERNRTALYHNCRRFLESHDVLATAVVGLEPQAVEKEYPTEVAGEKMRTYVDWLKFSFLATATTLPALSMPCGFTESGMPVGIQLIGPPRGEARLLAVARAIEDATGLAAITPIDPR